MFVWSGTSPNTTVSRPVPPLALPATCDFWMVRFWSLKRSLSICEVQLAIQSLPPNLIDLVGDEIHYNWEYRLGVFHTNGGWNCKKNVKSLFLLSFNRCLSQVIPVIFSISVCFVCDVYIQPPHLCPCFSWRDPSHLYIHLLSGNPNHPCKLNEGWIFETWIFETMYLSNRPFFWPSLILVSGSIPNRRSIALSPSTKRCIKTGQPPEEPFFQGKDDDHLTYHFQTRRNPNKRPTIHINPPSENSGNLWPLSDPKAVPPEELHPAPVRPGQPHRRRFHRGAGGDAEPSLQCGRCHAARLPGTVQVGVCCWGWVKDGKNWATSRVFSGVCWCFMMF